MADEITYQVFENRFRDKKYIGSGGFAKVFKVFDFANSHYVALKIASVRPEYKQFTLQREVELVNSLSSHPNIARYDACYRFDRGLSGEEDYAILKFYEDGNLDQFLKTHQVTKEDIRFIVKGILEGILFLHRNNIIHRDLKSQNILVHRDNGIWTPVITDFGLSKRIGGDTTLTNSSIGLSYAYAAPEQIKNEKTYKNVDLWATGVIIFRILTGELPFQSARGDDEKSASSQIEMTNKILNLELPEKLYSIPEPYQGMIKRCLVLNPRERAQSAEELIGFLDVGFMSSEQEQERPEEIAPTQVFPVLNNPADTLDAGAEYSSQAPPAWEPPTIPDYSTPNPGKTVIVQGKNEPTIPQRPTLNTGEPARRFPWRRIILAFIFVGSLLAIWLIWPEKSPVRDDDKGQYTVPVSFEELRQKNENARFDPDGLKAVSIEINEAISAHPKEYIPIYLMAKNKIYAGQAEEAFFYLKNAAERSIDSGSSGKMSADLKSDIEGAFQILSIEFPARWTSLIQALESNDKDSLNAK